MMFVKALIFATFCVAASLQQAPEAPKVKHAISECEGLPTPLNLYVDNCGEKCILYENSKATARWQFQANYDISSLKVFVQLKVPMGRTTRVYPIREDLLATSLVLGQNLPIKANTTGSVMFDVMVPKNTYTYIPFECMIQMVDQYNNTVSCFNALSEIRNKWSWEFLIKKM